MGSSLFCLTLSYRRLTAGNPFFGLRKTIALQKQDKRRTRVGPAQARKTPVEEPHSAVSLMALRDGAGLRGSKRQGAKSGFRDRNPSTQPRRTLLGHPGAIWGSQCLEIGLLKKPRSQVEAGSVSFRG